MQNLGYSNGWEEIIPEIVKSCDLQKHILETTREGQSSYKYTCPQCGYYFKVDCSG